MTTTATLTLHHAHTTPSTSLAGATLVTLNGSTPDGYHVRTTVTVKADGTAFVYPITNLATGRPLRAARFYAAAIAAATSYLAEHGTGPELAAGCTCGQCTPACRTALARPCCGACC